MTSIPTGTVLTTKMTFVGPNIGKFRNILFFFVEIHRIKVPKQCWVVKAKCGLYWYLVLWISDILVWIRICGSVTLTYDPDSDPAFFVSG